MGNLDDLKLRIEGIKAEVRDVIKLFKTKLADPRKTDPFGQVKEIENTIARLRRQGLPVPEELNKLKLDLFSTYQIHKEFILMYDEFKTSMHDLISEIPQEFAKRGRDVSVIRSSYKKLPNYEKPLGSKGNSNLEDYLIPVIKLMWDGYDHKESFRRIAKKLDVRYNTVSSQCTRGISLNTEEFIKKVNSKTIIDHLEYKYPDQYHTIRAQLKK